MFRLVQTSRSLGALLLFVCAFCLFGWFQKTPRASAHELLQARVVHILVTSSRIECYVNLLLPKTGKAQLWKRLFDRNRNRKLDAGERLLLGKFLAKRYVSKFVVTLNGVQQTLVLREVQNSRLRGNPKRGRYAWDYRFSVKDPDVSEDTNTMSLKMPVLFAKEMIPVAVVPMGNIKLLATTTSYLLRKKGRARAICRLDQKRDSCSFSWETSSPSSRPSSRPHRQ